ncbi:EcoKI restriction-modification system protein HsdS [Escherichia coli]|uniref:EcoKI restriction-modification system protein HsdS n=1 Tax=Escherichia coli TaxID=562 RepID=A0A376VQ03_ECOLX|nr:EcoKI restriction-modification system protein HsdS [Escherichia coli]
MSAGKLPEGWEQIEIGDIADVISGGTPKSGVAENLHLRVRESPGLRLPI